MFNFEIKCVIVFEHKQVFAKLHLTLLDTTRLRIEVICHM